MKRTNNRLTVLVFTVLLSAQPWAQQIAGQDFSFVISSDQRYHAKEQFHSRIYTLGGYEAIKKIGEGAFMVVVGDIDPVQATDDLIEQVFGEDYPWYPVVGNHDFENPDDLDFLRSMNNKENPLPKIVNRGPAGCEETNYAFDWNGVHFVVIDVFYEKSGAHLKYTPIDTGILDWLMEDLKRNQGKRIFVFGHKPVISVLDMDNGTRRHLGEVLDRYPDDALRFEQLLARYGVTAYISGHTHAASWANINGIWYLNSGHIYGQESDYTPKKLHFRLSWIVNRAGQSGVPDTSAIQTFFKSDPKELRKIVFTLDPIPGADYKVLSDEETLRALYGFYQDCISDSLKIVDYENRFWKNTDWRRSTFLKINIRGDSAVLEIYRDKDYTGNYELRHTQVLY